MTKNKNEKISGKPDDIFLTRLNNCQLLDVMDKIYKKEYNLSAKKYLLTVPLRIRGRRYGKNIGICTHFNY